MNAPALPGPMRRALADIVRFGSLIQHKGVYVANVLHYPELAHEPKTITALIGEGFAERHSDGSVVATAKARKTWAALEAEATAGAS